MNGTPRWFASLSFGFVSALLVVPLPARAADTVAQILANPKAYDGQTVDITGTARKIDAIQASSGLKGVLTRYRVQLCDGPHSCIFGITFEDPKVDTTKPVRVQGTYWVDHTAPRFTYVDRIEIKSISNP